MLKKNMKMLAIAALAVLMACGPSRPKDLNNEQQSQGSSEVASATDADTRKISEALGHFIGRNLKAPGVQFDLESIVKGMREGAAGVPAPMNDEEYEAAMAQLQEKAYNTLADTNMEAANTFMRDNANVQGVVEIVPGKLQYLILEEGQGPSVPEHGSPSINYTGKYLNGTVFGTSENAGGPITVPIDQAIPGFSKGVAGMKEGEKRRLFVHPEYGYGRTGQLPPNSLLVFDIEVVKAVPSEKENAHSQSTGSQSDEERDFDDDLEGDHDHELDESESSHHSS